MLAVAPAPALSFVFAVVDEPDPCEAWTYTSDALRRLAVEVLARAVKEAMGKGMLHGEHNYGDVVTMKARTWLVTEQCQLYCDVAGFSFDKICSWVERGCPEPDKRLYQDKHIRQQRKVEEDPHKGLTKVVELLAKKEKRGRQKRPVVLPGTRIID